MAYCSNCGAKVEGKFCANCGTPVEVEKHTSSSANNYKSPYVMETSSKASSQPPYNPGADVANYSMKWHRFMIYFWLWLCAAIDFIDGVSFIQISEYSAFFGLTGIVFIATAVFMASMSGFDWLNSKQMAPNNCSIITMLRWAPMR